MKKCRTIKLSIIIFIFVLVSFVGTSTAYAAASSNLESEQEIKNQLSESIEKQLSSIDWDGLEEFLRQSTTTDAGFFKEGIAQKVKQVLSGNFESSSTDFLQFLADIFFSELQSLMPMLVGIAVVCVISGLIDKTKSSMLNNGTSGLISFFCFSTVLLLLLTSIWKLYAVTKTTVTAIKQLTNLVMPPLLTLMAATGAATSAKVYNPAVVLLSEGVTEIVASVILPMFVFSVVFSIVSNLSNEIKLEKLASFFKNISNWVLGITFTIFTGFLAVQGLTAATIDGVSVRAAKFATKTYIPILGGYLADGFDLILASCILIKNSLGVVILLVLLCLVLSPITNILVFNFGLQLISALTEPIADKKIVKFLSDIQKNLTLLLVAILAVSFMLFIFIMLIIFSANLL